MNTFGTDTDKKSVAAHPEGGIDPRHFSDMFRFIIAHTPQEKQRAFSLRHEVFHEELHYNIGEKTNAPLEKDAHDHNSILCLLQHRKSGMDAGCLRVVIIDSSNEKSPKPLPLEEYCDSSLNDPDLHPKKFPIDAICEVSRLAVHPLFRKNVKPPTGIKDEDINKVRSINEKPQPALIGLSLFLAATALVGLSHRRHVFAMLEPRFNRLLKASGLHFQKVGKTIVYCGTRAAYYIDQRKAEENLPEETIFLYQHIKEELASQINQTDKPKNYQNTTQ